MIPRAALAARDRGLAAAHGAQAWVERQSETSPPGVAISWYTRYRDADGQQYALLLTGYMFVTLVPAVLVVAGFASDNPEALATRLINRLGLTGETADLARSVLVGTGNHRLTATLVAVASVILFATGIGRALQLVFARAWRIEARGLALTDHLLYLSTVLVLLLAAFAYVLQTVLLAHLHAPGWVGWALTPLWLGVLVALLAWLPIHLLHHRLTLADVLPGALLGATGLGVVRLISSWRLTESLNWYARFYGGLGIVMAIFFWLLLLSTVIVATSALSPAYAQRRRARAAMNAAIAASSPTSDEADEPPR